MDQSSFSLALWRRVLDADCKKVDHLCGPRQEVASSEPSGDGEAQSAIRLPLIGSAFELAVKKLVARRSSKPGHSKTQKITCTKNKNKKKQRKKQRPAPKQISSYMFK